MLCPTTFLRSLFALGFIVALTLASPLHGSMPGDQGEEARAGLGNEPVLYMNVLRIEQDDRKRSGRRFAPDSLRPNTHTSFEHAGHRLDFLSFRLRAGESRQIPLDRLEVEIGLKDGRGRGPAPYVSSSWNHRFHHGSSRMGLSRTSETQQLLRRVGNRHRERCFVELQFLPEGGPAPDLATSPEAMFHRYYARIDEHDHDPHQGAEMAVILLDLLRFVNVEELSLEAIGELAQRSKPMIGVHNSDTFGVVQAKTIEDLADQAALRQGHIGNFITEGPTEGFGRRRIDRSSRAFYRNYALDKTNQPDHRAIAAVRHMAAEDDIESLAEWKNVIERDQIPRDPGLRKQILRKLTSHVDGREISGLLTILIGAVLTTLLACFALRWLTGRAMFGSG